MHTTCRAASKEVLIQEAWDEEVLISEEVPVSEQTEEVKLVKIPIVELTPSDFSIDRLPIPSLCLDDTTDMPNVTAIDRTAKSERTYIDVEKDDYLLNQIDEFRAKAQQLQELLLSKESKVNELQTIVDEREIKAKELEHILNERQRKADGITAEVAQQIDNLIEKVSAKMEEIGTSIGTDLENGQKLSEEQMVQLRETLALLTEQLDNIKEELSNKVHSENVKCYRNIADLFKSMDDKMDTVKKENQFILQKADFIHKCTIAVIVLSVLNMIGIAVSVFINIGVFH